LQHGKIAARRVEGKFLELLWYGTAPTAASRPAKRERLSDKPIAGGSTMALRDDYQTLMEKQLNEWKVQTERFKAGAEQIAAHTKVQYEKNLETLRATQADAWDSFSKLKNANESAWTEFKAHMDKAEGEVKAAVERMTTHLKQ
jgi:hypothetical protein